jgi:hypothetical protein
MQLGGTVPDANIGVGAELPIGPLETEHEVEVEDLVDVHARQNGHDDLVAHHGPQEFQVRAESRLTVPRDPLDKHIVK